MRWVGSSEDTLWVELVGSKFKGVWLGGRVYRTCRRCTNTSVMVVRAVWREREEEGDGERETERERYIPWCRWEMIGKRERPPLHRNSLSRRQRQWHQ